MRLASKEREIQARREGGDSGIGFKYVPGSYIPGDKLWEKKNSEARVKRVDTGLFADDTSGIGKKEELEAGMIIVKENMKRVEEKNNDSKEETIIFGSEEGGKVRVLGSYLSPAEDIKQRIKRANGAWIKVKNQLKGSRMSRNMQARVIQAVVESSLLFDCQV